MQIVQLKCNAKGRLIGEDHANAKHTDALVKEARKMHAAGQTAIQISKVLSIPRRTVRGWLEGRRRTQVWVKVRTKRIYK